MIKYLIILLILPVSAFCASYGDLKCDFLSNYDGDTITCNISGVHPIIGEKIRVRVRGVDTPEIRKPKEAKMAIRARDFTRRVCSEASEVILRDISRGKYFRIVADVF